MGCVSMISEALERTFITALLLTGSAEGAEAAVLEGIRSLDRSSVSGEALLKGTMAASIAMTITRPRVEDQDRAASLLPPELRRVLGLSREFRRCFVLRILAGLSRETCARMLQTETRRVDEIVSSSARQLACAARHGSPQLNYSTACTTV